MKAKIKKIFIQNENNIRRNKERQQKKTFLNVNTLTKKFLEYLMKNFISRFSDSDYQTICGG